VSEAKAAVLYFWLIKEAKKVNAMYDTFHNLCVCISLSQTLEEGWEKRGWDSKGVLPWPCCNFWWQARKARETKAVNEAENFCWGQNIFPKYYLLTQM